MSDTADRKPERRGRPAYDDLQIYAFVEAGLRRTGLNVKAYCSSTKIPVAKGIGKGQNGQPWQHPIYEHKTCVVLTGEALRSRYYKARRKAHEHDFFLPAGAIDPHASMFNDQLELLIKNELELQSQLS